MVHTVKVSIYVGAIQQTVVVGIITISGANRKTVAMLCAATISAFPVVKERLLSPLPPQASSRPVAATVR